MSGFHAVAAAGKHRPARGCCPPHNCRLNMRACHQAGTALHPRCPGPLLPPAILTQACKHEVLALAKSNACCLWQRSRTKRLRVRTWGGCRTAGGTWRRQKAPGLRPTAAAFASRRVMHGQREHDASLRSACVALGAPPCATGGHGEMLFTHLAPRKRAPKRVAEGGASNRRRLPRVHFFLEASHKRCLGTSFCHRYQFLSQL